MRLKQFLAITMFLCCCFPVMGSDSDFSENIVEDYVFKKDIEHLRQSNLQTIQKYFNLKEGNFYQGVTDEEKSLVYAAYKENHFDLMLAASQEFFYRFNRAERQPFVEVVERKKVS